MVSKPLKRAPRILAPVAVLYDRRLKRFGARPEGVFWLDADGQRLRFEILSRIMEGAGESVIVNDLGCGYGAFFRFLKDRPVMEDGLYLGYDISKSMVEKAKRLNDDPRAKFVQGPIATWRADYSFASGTYNMRMDTDTGEWAEYVRASLVQLWSASERGLAFNMLADEDSIRRGKPRQDDLYYARSREYLDFCRRELSPHSILIDDYPLAEWTIAVSREPSE